jgi:drug/metabolite transporter (DMT)-like permease
VTAYQLLAALAVAGIVWSTTAAGGWTSTFGDPSVLQWVAALATGLLGSAIPFLLYTFAVARLPAARTGLPLNLIPVFGVLSAVVLLDERLVTTQLLGGLLVVVGLGAAQLGPPDYVAGADAPRRKGLRRVEAATNPLPVKEDHWSSECVRAR